MSGFIPTEGQSRALDMVSNLLACDEAAFGILRGVAGSGKTSIIKEIAKIHGTPVVIAPTGKAALRVTEATGLAASTIHRYLYKCGEDPKTGEPIWNKKSLTELAIPSSHLLIVDEASMLSELIWDDIWLIAQSVGLKVLLVGDPFQLPPVVKKRDSGIFVPYSVLDMETQFRVDLTEVVRQALDNPIIRASAMIRQSELGAIEAITTLVENVDPAQVVDRFLAMDPDRAMICWRNKTRNEYNQAIRSKLGLDPENIAPGEPLLVLRNNYVIDRFNGEVVTFKNWVHAPGDQIAVKDRFNGQAAYARFGVADVEKDRVVVSPEEVFGATGELGLTTIARSGKGHIMGRLGYGAHDMPSYLNANFGYCLTCHKAQGSEYKDVMVLVEPGRHRFTYEDRRWIYTSLTRSRVNVCVSFI